MIKLEILHVFSRYSFRRLVNKIIYYDELGYAFESRAQIVFFYFSNRKIFYDPIQISRLPMALDRFKVLIRVIISELYMAWRKNSLKYYLIGGGGGGTFVPHAQTVSRSLMPKLDNRRIVA